MRVEWLPAALADRDAIIAYLEAQASYIRQALMLMRDRGAAAIEAWPLAVHPAWLSQRVRVERARQEVAELRLLSDS